MPDGAPPSVDDTASPRLRPAAGFDDTTRHERPQNDAPQNGVPKDGVPKDDAQKDGTPKDGLFARIARAFRPQRERGQGLNGVIDEDVDARLSVAERQMIERIVAFDKKRVEDVAIPRADIIGVEADVSLPELLQCFSEAGHSRLPVYRGDLDDPVGMVHIKDLVGLLADPDRAEPRAELVGDDAAQGRPILEGLTRKVLYVPPSMPITDLLLRMQASRIHMALVIDEFGGTDGLATIEDLIEEIVGDIRDEHDEDEDLAIRRTKSGRLDADARMPLDELLEKTGLDLALPDEEADTLGGLVFLLVGRVPLRGEIISHPCGAEFEVADADPRRIRRVLIRTTSLQKKDGEDGEGGPAASSGGAAKPA